MKKPILIFLLLVTIKHLTIAQSPVTLNLPDDGYRGIWYFIGALKNDYRYKYSGGLGTYPSNHHPFAVYAPEVEKTFFCYGGSSKHEQPSLLHEVGVFDHRLGVVSRPTIVLDKGTNDAHDNPVINIDEKGYVWLFSTSHGTERPSFIHKSKLPYDISSFEHVRAIRAEGTDSVLFNNFSYLQSHYLRGKGFFHLTTHYDRGVLKYGANKARRTIGYITSADGVRWSALKDIAVIEEGHYQTSAQRQNKIGTSFNFHPNTEHGSGLDYRTNLYYVETTNFGERWTTAGGQAVSLPITTVQHAALVHNYQAEGLNVYINDVAFDSQNNPIIFYLTSHGPHPGPDNGPYTWRTAYWNDGKWNMNIVTTSDHNYDMGSLYIEDDHWYIIGPAGGGPQPYCTGGEMSLWTSLNQGKNWKKTMMLTENSAYNHSYARRPVNANANFYAFWADGNGLNPSASSLYFCTKSGEVFRLPKVMAGSVGKPEPVNARKK
ncbi:MAG TPA: BNR-4 repeat-containing protein [Chryseolinea sp.]|nr:BNR-4 repeat-containing protein [Chryseolinea sp.]